MCYYCFSDVGFIPRVRKHPLMTEVHFIFWKWKEALHKLFITKICMPFSSIDL